MDSVGSSTMTGGYSESCTGGQLGCLSTPCGQRTVRWGLLGASAACCVSGIAGLAGVGETLWCVFWPMFGCGAGGLLVGATNEAVRRFDPRYVQSTQNDRLQKQLKDVQKECRVMRQSLQKYQQLVKAAQQFLGEVSSEREEFESSIASLMQKQQDPQQIVKGFTDILGIQDQFAEAVMQLQQALQSGNQGENLKAASKAMSKLNKQLSKRSKKGAPEVQKMEEQAAKRAKENKLLKNIAQTVEQHFLALVDAGAELKQQIDQLEATTQRLRKERTEAKTAGQVYQQEKEELRQSLANVKGLQERISVDDITQVARLIRELGGVERVVTLLGDRATESGGAAQPSARSGVLSTVAGVFSGAASWVTGGGKGSEEASSSSGTSNDY